jgi:uncharacterized protein (TIGR02145 family)
MQICEYYKPKKAKMNIRFLPLLLFPLIGIAQTNSQVEMPISGSTVSEKQPVEIKRNSHYNLDEIKVRWKKTALENCAGTPCVYVIAPGPVSLIVATPTGPSSAIVSFEKPTSDGGSPITGYVVTATPTASAPAKRKSSSIITVRGTSSPIEVTGLSFGVNYIFTVVATNAVGGSSGTSTIITVTPCTLNKATSVSTTVLVNTVIVQSIYHTTEIATGIGTVTGLPEGVNASWSANRITLSGTPTQAGIFNYTILLTGGCGSVNATGTITVTLVPSFICGTSTVSDYDGIPYSTVLIDNQCWTKENLKVTKYNDGTDIPEVTNGSSWATLNTGARAVYATSGTPVNGYVVNYGYLYNWYAVNDSKKICPEGWHVPSGAEWASLINYMGGWEVAGGKMKSTGDNVAGTGLWNPANTGTDLYGFTAHPGGYRLETSGDFGGIKSSAGFWSATESSDPSKAQTTELAGFSPAAPSGNRPKVYGYSVRCLKDL